MTNNSEQDKTNRKNIETKKKHEKLIDADTHTQIL